MNKEEILEKARNEGEEIDLPDIDALKDSYPYATLVGSTLLIIVEIVNFIVFHKYICGPGFALQSMIFTLFLQKYLRLRKRRDLIIAILFGFTSLFKLVEWILQLTGVF